MLGSPHLVSGVGVDYDSPLEDVRWAITNFVHVLRKALITFDHLRTVSAMRLSCATKSPSTIANPPLPSEIDRRVLRIAAR